MGRLPSEAYKAVRQSMRCQNSQVPKIICLSGVDGSGKTTLSKMLSNEFHKKGYNVSYVWMRYNHYFTKPLLGFCRLVGLTKYYKIDNYRIGFHLFYKSKPISILFIFFKLIDTYIATILKLVWHRTDTDTIVICDRYVVDILVDIMIDTKKLRLYQTTIGRMFSRLVPEKTIIFYINRPKNELLEARPELQYDPFFNLRNVLYDQLAERWRLRVIQNDGDIFEAYYRIISQLPQLQNCMSSGNRD